MEYYILKLYEEKKKENNLKIGINRFSKGKKIFMIILLILMIAFAILMTFFIFKYQDDLMFLKGMVPLVITVLTVLIIDSKDEKTNINNHIDEYKRKLNLLNEILQDTFAINSKDKIEKLLKIYKSFVEKKDKEDAARNKVIIALFTCLSTILSVSFANMEKIGLDFMNWIYIAAVLIIFVCILSIVIYNLKYYDSLRRKYNNIISDLESLIIYKYNDNW